MRSPVPAQTAFTCLFLLSVGCSTSKLASSVDGGPADAAAANHGGDAGTSDSAGRSATGESGSSASKAGSGAAKAGSGGSPGEAGRASTGTSGHSAAAGSGATLPDDGNQLALCTKSQGECNKGYACYSPASSFSSGRGFCSKVCTMASDCDGLTPTATKYTCASGPGTHVCEAVCSGTDDTQSCPSNMICVQTGAAPSSNAGSGGGGATASFRCKYPFETSAIWGPCGDAIHACDKGLTCNGMASGRAGHCTQSCEMDADCKDHPSTGTITPTCATISAARGMMMATKLCVLSCADAKDGCPTGQTCVEGPKSGMNMMSGYSRCEY